MAVTTIVPSSYSPSLQTTLGGVPVAEYAITIPPESAVHYTSGLALSANEGHSFTIAKGCTSVIGTTSTKLQLDLSGSTYAGLFVHAGESDAHVTPTTTFARTRKIGNGSLYGSGGTWTTVEHSTGLSDFNDTAVVTTLIQTGGAVTIDEHSSSTVTTATVVGRNSVLNCSRGVATLNVHGSNVTMPDRTATITTLTVTGEGRVVHSGGTITTVNGYEGVLDLSGVSANITITTLNRYSNAFTIIPPQPPYALTITNENYFGNAAVLGV